MDMMAMARITVLAMARRKALRRRSADASGGGFQHPARRLASIFCAALSVLLACPGWAAKWEIVPSFSADETYTDNLRLSAPGSEQSDWVTTLNPRLSVRASGERLRLAVDYSPQILLWAQEGSSTVLHNYNASGTVEFVKKTLFLDVRSSQSQENISLLGPQTDSNVNITGNRTSVRSSQISPFLRHDFGLDAQGEARLSYSTVNTGSTTDLSDSQATGVDVKLTSGPTFKLLTWNAAYKREHIYYNQAQFQNVDTQRIFAGAKRLITSQLGLLANVGYDDDNYLTLGPAPKGVFWNLGPEWNPTPRTHLAATLGRNYLGATRSLDFSHRTRLTVWTANYSQDITTTRDQFLFPSTLNTAGYLDTLFLSSIPDPAARQSAVNAFISQNGLPTSFGSPVNFFTNVPFLVKRLQGSIAVQGVKNTVLANLFTETREALASGQPGGGDFALSQKTRQTGASVLWTARISGKTSSSLSVGLTRNEFIDTGREDTEKFIRLGITHQFLPRVSGALNFRRLQNVSSQSGAAYTENAVSVTLLAQF
jgi:uncharacterized protein (PEP-CTERM system associated)